MCETERFANLSKQPGLRRQLRENVYGSALPKPLFIERICQRRKHKNRDTRKPSTKISNLTERCLRQRVHIQQNHGWRICRCQPGRFRSR